MICNSCSHDNPAGSTHCEACGEPLGHTAFQPIASSPASGASVVASSMGSAPATGPDVSALVPLKADRVTEDTSNCIVLPAGEFTWSVGRTDLDMGFVAQLDFDARMPRLIRDDQGTPFVSRKAAVLRRDYMGTLFIQRDIESSSRLLIQQDGEQPIALLRGDEAVIIPGAKVIFGKGSYALILVGI